MGIFRSKFDKDFLKTHLTFYIKIFIKDCYLYFKNRNYSVADCYSHNLQSPFYSHNLWLINTQDRKILHSGSRKNPFTKPTLLEMKFIYYTGGLVIRPYFCLFIRPNNDLTQWLNQWGPWKRRKTNSSAIFYATSVWGLI